MEAAVAGSLRGAFYTRLVKTSFAIPDKCRAFCGTIENSPEGNSGLAHFMFESRVPCGTTGFDSDEKGNSAVQLKAGLDSEQRSLGVAPPGYSQPCRKGRGTALGRCSLRRSEFGQACVL